MTLTELFTIYETLGSLRQEADEPLVKGQDISVAIPATRAIPDGWTMVRRSPAYWTPGRTRIIYTRQITTTGENA
jgi:hypothetical protein